MVSASQVYIREMVESVATQASEGVRAEIELFAKSLANKTRRGRDSRVRRIHEIAGKEAQQATLRSFRRKHPRKGYSRSKSRMANGAMIRAIASPAFYTARYDGVSFANRAVLDQTAKQWYRLNFGAGAVGVTDTTPPQPYSLKFFDSIAGVLTLKEYKPSDPFGMPKGIWIEKGVGPGGPAFPSSTGRSDRKLGREITGTGNPGLHGPQKAPFTNNEFLALGPNASVIETLKERKGTRANFQEKIRTKGIVGSNYLDAGVQSLAKNIGSGWTVLMKEWFQEAAHSGTGPVALAAGDANINGADIARMNDNLVERTRSMKVALAQFESVLR